MGGRGSASGVGRSSARSTTYTADSFTQTSPGMWESKQRSVDAAVPKRDANRNVVGVIKSTAPTYTIQQVGDRFRVYRTRMNLGRMFVKSEKSLDKAIKYINKYENE